MRFRLIFLFLVFFALLPQVNAALSTNVIAYYNFEETAGTTIEDVATADYNGTLVSATLGRTGKINKAYFFDGGTDRFTIPSTLLTDNNAISFWVNITTGVNGDKILDHVVDASNENRIWVGSDPDFRARGFDEAAEWDFTNINISRDTWHHIVLTWNNTGSGYAEMWVDNISVGSDSAVSFNITGGTITFMAANSGANSIEGMIDELAIFNKTLNSSEVNSLWNLGNGVPYPFTGTPITLVSPAKNYISSEVNITFNATLDPSGIGVGYQNVNASLHVWYANGSILTSQTNEVSGSVANSTVWNVSNIGLGNYYWNVEGCFTNTTVNQCTFSSNNRSFTVGASIVLQNYSNYTFETKYENFEITVNLLNNSEVSLAQLVYNSTNYTVSDIEISGSTISFSKRINIPTNSKKLGNNTNEFFWRFVFTSGEDSAIQTTPTQYQDVGYINFQLCNSTYATVALNFSFYNEINQSRLENTTSSLTTFESSWNYWVGNGDVYKSYSFQNLSSKTDEYHFCIYPFNESSHTFKATGDIDYFAANFRENEYHLRNATLTNVSSNIWLYLINNDYATKFFLTFQKGSSLARDSVVTVQKYFTGLGQYITTAILSTDNDGVATMWQEVDATYRYSVVKNGELLGTADKISVCAVAPCALTILLDDPTSDIYSPYYGKYAQNIVSTLVYDEDTKVVTYTFLDTTGLANYFRLVATEVRLNQTGADVCDEKLFSPAGTLSCNLTSYSGEFVVKGYISRSPELVDKIINVITEEGLIDSIGEDGLFLVIAVLLTLVIAAAVVSKGSPSAILAVFGVGILILKLMSWFPFTWPIVAALEFIISYILWKVKV